MLVGWNETDKWFDYTCEGDLITCSISFVTSESMTSKWHRCIWKYISFLVIWHIIVFLTSQGHWYLLYLSRILSLLSCRGRCLFLYCVPLWGAPPSPAELTTSAPCEEPLGSFTTEITESREGNDSFFKRAPTQWSCARGLGITKRGGGMYFNSTPLLVHGITEILRIKYW